MSMPLPGPGRSGSCGVRSRRRRVSALRSWSGSTSSGGTRVAAVALKTIPLGDDLLDVCSGGAPSPHLQHRPSTRHHCGPVDRAGGRVGSHRCPCRAPLPAHQEQEAPPARRGARTSRPRLRCSAIRRDLCRFGPRGTMWFASMQAPPSQAGLGASCGRHSCPGVSVVLLCSARRYAPCSPLPRVLVQLFDMPGRQNTAIDACRKSVMARVDIQDRGG